MSKPETEETSTDDLAKDLREIVNKALHRCHTRALRSAEVRLDHVSEARQQLMQDLSIYIVNRDGKVLEHGIKVGKDQINVK